MAKIWGHCSFALAVYPLCDFVCLFVCISTLLSYYCLLLLSSVIGLHVPIRASVRDHSLAHGFVFGGLTGTRTRSGALHRRSLPLRYSVPRMNWYDPRSKHIFKGFQK
jgi:hypothetical protein